MVKETVVEDVDDPEQGQETPSKLAVELLPSSRGRIRKKNSRYLDYVTSYANENPEEQEVLAKKPPAKVAKAAVATTPRKTPRKPRPEEKVLPASADVCTPPQLPNGDSSTLSNVSPLPATEGSLENGTPKPKRKYVKKIINLEPVTPCEKIQDEEPEELPPGRRPRRGAAKVAMKLLHSLVDEEFNHSSEAPNATSDVSSKPTPETTDKTSSQKKKRQKRKFSDDPDNAEDEDFVPDAAEVEEDEEEEEEEYEEKEEALDHSERQHASAARILKTPSLLNSAVLENVNNHKKFREEQLSKWVFPEWLPSSSVWHPVPPSELESYLPQETVSAAFKVSRDGCDEETPLQRLKRFESFAAHPQCWDMHLFTGGPVWAMEWCPTPDRALASQYLAIACHKGMEDQHYSNQIYSGPALVQLWDVSTLEYDTRPNSQPALAYGLVLDQGFIWHLKWCPSGGWESPTSPKKAPLLPRLGLLAVTGSAGVVSIYSLPHPDALHASQKMTDPGDASQPACIYKADPVVTLKMGSLKAPRMERSGQVLSMDWLPVKPHDVIVIGFYDGMVGLWDLNTKSALLRIQELHDSPPILLPYKCFLAHDHAVRALMFCPTSRHLLATAGEDRHLKTWDLRRLYGPITVQKRSLINEICWPTNAAGLLWGQDTGFVGNKTNGVHYYDHKMQSYFPIPRLSTIWSISYSDWVNVLLVSDMLGDLLLCILPAFVAGFQYVKKTLDRRFPVYMTTTKRLHATGETNEKEQEVCEEDDEAEGGRDGDGKVDIESQAHESYKEAKRKYYLHLDDNNMKFFNKYGRLWKQMKATEVQNNIDMDALPLASLHKVRFNPNLSCHTWIASGGRAGLVRLNCIRGLNNKDVGNLICRARADPLGVPLDAPLDVPQDTPMDTPPDVPKDTPRHTPPL